MDEPFVETACGKLRGMRDGPTLAFLGIPFAARPTGPRRFRAPEPASPWAGVRDAVAFGSVAPQQNLAGAGGVSFGAPDLGAAISEDCLYLNVWTPGLDSTSRPVMVWIAGGGYVLGSGSLKGQTPSRLARCGDVVVVSFNYRLGILGYAHFDALCRGAFEADANVGVRDQIAALLWVRDNIAAFGGDPRNVTIFGESAGGMSVGTLLGIPSARGLFHGAIAQSGAAHNVSDRETADRFAHGLLKALDLTPSTAAKMLELDSKTLVEAQLRTYDIFRDMTWPGSFVDPSRISAAWNMAYQPVIDGDLLPAGPLDTIATGQGADVPLIVGSTRDDQRMSELIDPRCPQDADTLAEAMAVRIPGAEHAARVLAAYPWPNDERPTAARAFSAMETHRLFRIPALRLAEAHAARGHKAYVYLFDWASPIAPLGSSHGLELPFLFDLLDEPGMDLYAGKGPEAEALAQTLKQAWFGFAQTGVPSAGDRPWASYDTETRPVMRLGAACGQYHEPMTGELAAWDGLL